MNGWDLSSVSHILLEKSSALLEGYQRSADHLCGL
jgi:hypothetical protein